MRFMGFVKMEEGVGAPPVALMKAALILRHNTIPPQVNFAQPNPALALDADRYYIPTDMVSPDEPLGAAGVSSKRADRRQEETGPRGRGCGIVWGSTRLIQRRK